MRESGILMPVSSLPGPYGIGCFGKAALEFVDFLAEAGQTIWQILPLSPTGYGDSPYQSCSAFAGNPYFIDLDALKAEGLLTAAQLKAEDVGQKPAGSGLRHPLHQPLQSAPHCLSGLAGAVRRASTAARFIIRMIIMPLRWPTRPGWRITPCTWPLRPNTR